MCVDGELCKKNLTALEQENGDLPQVEVDKVTCLVRNIRAEVASDDTMPCWVILLVELLLDVCGDVLRKTMETNQKRVVVSAM